MSEHEDAPPAKIKVTDRRLFDKDGNFRDDAPEESSTAPVEAAGESAPAPESAPEASTPEPVAAPVESVPESAAADVATEPDESAVAPEPEATTQFAEEALMRFIEEQYIGGLLALGAMPEPQTGQVMEDLDLAQVRIEMLGLLRDHAASSLSLEAQKGIDDVIYQLRMAYLQKRKVVKL